MSIIVDALERVQTDRHEDQVPFQSDALSEKNSEFIDHYANSETSEPKPYLKFIIGGLILVAGINVFFMFQNSNQNEIPFGDKFQESDILPEVETVSEAGLESGLGELSREQLDKNDAEFFSTFEDEDIPELTPPPEIAKTLPQIDNTASIENNISLAPAWLISGKQTFRTDGLSPAINLWNEGFSTLDSKTPIISIMINRVPELASDTLNTLHNNQIDAFSVQGLFKGKPAYFTLALYNENNALNLMANIEQLIDSKPFKSSQSFVQKRMDQLNQKPQPTLAIATTPVPAPAVKKPIIKSKPAIKINIRSKKISSKKRLLLGKEAVINGDYKQAILKLRPVLFNDKTNWEVLFWIGSAKLGLGLYKEADDYFRNALALNSEMPQLWTQRAIIAQERNDHVAALKYLHRAQTISPNSPEVVLNIAYSNDALGDRNGAILSYREFLVLTRGNGSFAQQRQAVNFRLEELGF